LVKAIAHEGLSYVRKEGEAVFYGPKIDVKLVDALGRKWQTSTVQFDFNLPRRFDVQFVDHDGVRRNVYMVHRAIYGSLERFIGMLTEHYAGDFPLWLAPVQATVLPVADAFVAYGRQVERSLLEAGLRVHLDAREEKIGRKIRDAETEKIPYMLVVGEREAGAGEVAVRRHGHGNVGNRPVAAFAAELLDEIRAKR
jgi:threonyl-tRNA synthetase